MRQAAQSGSSQTCSQCGSKGLSSLFAGRWFEPDSDCSDTWMLLMTSRTAGLGDNLNNAARDCAVSKRWWSNQGAAPPGTAVELFMIGAHTSAAKIVRNNFWFMAEILSIGVTPG